MIRRFCYHGRMSKQEIRRALISVYDKTGIVEFARALVDEFGIEIISTGGTAKLLKEKGIPVRLIEEVTGFAEMMDGRVKTLHPKIHAGILADRDNPEHMEQLEEQGIEPIDMVVVNLYPFEETIARPGCTFEEAIEMIDIGGPCLLRAGAKNHRHVVVVSDEDGQGDVIAELREHGDIGPLLRIHLAEQAFSQTASYDDEIAGFLGGRVIEGLAERSGALDEHLGDLEEETEGEIPFVEGPWFDLQEREVSLHAKRMSRLRYGENPHQLGLLYIEDEELTGHRTTEPSLPYAKLLGDKEMSFNNYADANAALALCGELARNAPTLGKTCCVFVKHTNACGAGVAGDQIEAYRLAYLGDPNAAMGGILAQNTAVTAENATAVMDSLSRWGKAAGAGAFFVEVWLAPSFDAEALTIIRSMKKWGENVRLLAVGDLTRPLEEGEADLKQTVGGLLAQSRDLVGLNEDQWKVVTERRPTEAETADLRLAWLVCKHTKSNAITVCRDGVLIGNGAGQMSRVMSCRIATWLAGENGHEEKLRGAAASSDAFFPFRDGPDILMDAGVTAIIQPGGSKRDADTIAACDERGVTMVFTGTRHFRH